MTRGVTQQIFTGFRKEARVRLRVKSGKGNVFINGTPLHLLGDEIAREKIMTPLRMDEKFWKSHDFFLHAEGGGMIGVADAVAQAIARSIAASNPATKEKIMGYNRYLLAGDPRRTEPKKPNRRSARRFKQKSYR
ncbi:MAG: 30S ribosomal protein S9 [Aigarchaeota archaeon]|nr:30S ribosomal protein S9 [Aigarchaeota archaeon]MDW8092276.1 30S ribosomal protein S9 [Nitrososphaerota archaeon]